MVGIDLAHFQRLHASFYMLALFKHGSTQTCKDLKVIFVLTVSETIHATKECEYFT